MSPFCVERSTEMVLMVQIVQFFVLALSQTDDNATKPANVLSGSEVIVDERPSKHAAWPAFEGGGLSAFEPPTPQQP
jgi:hypothetical protein